MKREFQNGDMAYLTNGKRMEGFTLKQGSGVKIVSAVKIEDKHGGYLYTIEATNPKTGETVVLEEWLTQHDFMTKSMHKKMVEQDALIASLQAKKTTP